MLVEHIQANFQFVSGLMCWLSFWAVDMNSSTVPESKIYQAKLWKRGKEHELHLFRLKPTEEGAFFLISFGFCFSILLADIFIYFHLNLCVSVCAEIASVEVEPPSPMQCDDSGTLFLFTL